MEEGINLPDIIICPKCKHELTHQIATEIFSRKEDGEEVSTSIDAYDGNQRN